MPWFDAISRTYDFFLFHNNTRLSLDCVGVWTTFKFLKFTGTGGNEAGVDLVLKKTFLLFYYVNHVVLRTGQFCPLENERFYRNIVKVTYLHVHSKARELNPQL